jgi:zinc/manganese transport system substrate-binding protein
MRMAEAVDGMVEFLEGEVAFADPDAIATSAAAYVGQLESLDAESVTMFEAIPDERRVLVTNHDSLGYFADHYGFEVAGAVIPGGTTTDAASAGELAELAELIRDEQVTAIFADNTASDELAQALAAEVGSDVEVIEIYTGSLGEPGSDGVTYLLMLGTNAERITAGLA